MLKAYLASPFFNEREREVKARIKAHLETILDGDNLIEVCDPQTPSNFESWEQSNCDWGLTTFNKDATLLRECDFVVAIDWGLYGDCGTAWEIGYAFGKSIPVIVVVPTEALTTPHSIMTCNGSFNFLTEARFLNCQYIEDLENYDFFANGVEQK